MAMTNVKDIAITEIVDMTVFDITTGNYWFGLEELQNWTLNQTEETSDVTGRAGRLLSRLKKNKAVNISGTHGLISAGLLEIQTGSKFAAKTATVRWTETLTVTSNKATTSYTAIGTAGSEIVELYVKASDGTLGTEKTQAGTAAADKFAYDPSTKQITFYSGEVADGSEVYVVYDRYISANVLDVDSGKLSGKGKVYMNCLGEDTCGNIYRVQIYFPKLSFSGNFSIATGGDQATHNFEAVAESGGCSGASDYFTWTVFGANASDASV